MRTLLLVLFSFWLLPVQAQIAIIQFEGQQFGSGNRISWTVGRGNTCQDLEVQHSTDGMTFTTVYLYAGICGNANFDQTYNWIHSSPAANADNYYRIISATTVMTNTITIHYIPFGLDGFVLYPQPATTTVQLRLNNTNAGRYHIEVFDLSGKCVLDQEGITEPQVIITNPTGRPAVYLIRVTREGQEPKTQRLIFQ